MKFLNRRLVLLFLLPHAVIFLLMAFTPNVALIGVFNVVNLSIAVMVVVSFSPVVYAVLAGKNRTVDPPDYLGMGIFLSWLATILLRSYSIIWRWAGQPAWLTDSDLLSYSLFVQLSAGVLHLAAPGAIENRVPPRRWIKIGIAVGLAVLLSIVMGYFLDALAIDHPLLR